MPYRRLRDLPDSVRENVPKHAQEIYREAFNSAWDHYRDPDERRAGAGRDETAHRVAWSAIKRNYTKGDDDRWHPKHQGGPALSSSPGRR